MTATRDSTIWWNGRRSGKNKKTTKPPCGRVEAWPEAARAELAELALEIDAGLGAGKYQATPEELAGIERGLKAAREGRFATDEQIEELFKKASTCMKVIYTDEASEDLDGILAYIASNYPTVYEAF
jgi:hypothetical protein